MASWMLPTCWRKKRVGKSRRTFYVGRAEHGISPPFHGGQSTGGSESNGRDDDPRLHQPHRTGSWPTARSRRRKRAIAQFSAAFSKSSVHFEDRVAAGDKVVSRCILHRTHDRGKFMGV